MGEIEVKYTKIGNAPRRQMTKEEVAEFSLNREAAAGDVKREAMRRILAIAPEWRQRNLTAQAAILADKGRDNWTSDELSAWHAGEAIWKKISEIRAASDTIEAMDPIPSNYAADKYWTQT